MNIFFVIDVKGEIEREGTMGTHDFDKQETKSVGLKNLWNAMLLIMLFPNNIKFSG